MRATRITPGEWMKSISPSKPGKRNGIKHKVTVDEAWAKARAGSHLTALEISLCYGCCVETVHRMTDPKRGNLPPAAIRLNPRVIKWTRAQYGVLLGLDPMSPTNEGPGHDRQSE